MEGLIICNCASMTNETLLGKILTRDMALKR